MTDCKAIATDARARVEGLLFASECHHAALRARRTVEALLAA